MRALLVTHRPPHQPGGAAARWRSLLPALRDRGWEVEIAASDTVDDLAAVGSAEAESVQRRARRISVAKRLARLPFAVARIEVPPRSTAWVLRGASVVRRHLRSEPDVVVATGPPMVALVAARLALRGRDVPFVVELRDLWAGNPVYDRGGSLLPRLERWIFSRAHRIVVCTPEALADVRARHPDLADRCVVIPNGFEPVLLEQRTTTPRTRPLVLLHSGVLTPQRPLAPILNVLGEAPYAGAVKLVLHGFLAPELAREVAAAPPGVEVEVIAPSDWRDATHRIAAAGATLVTQSRAAGDDTAVASKVYEYLALGKPVLCVTDGGATEALLRRLGADRFCARLDDPASIRVAIDRLLAEDPPPLPASELAPYSRAQIADATAELLADSARARR